MAEDLVGASGYRSYWARALVTAVVLVLGYGILNLVRVSQAQRDGQNLVATVVVTVAVTFGAFLLLWGLSGLGPWALMRQLARDERSTVGVTQRSPALDEALAKLCGKDVSGPFYFVVRSSDAGIQVFARGAAILELSWSEVGEVAPATTRVRGLELPCVALATSISTETVQLPLQLGRNPWRALFPTSPRSLTPLSASLSKFRPGPGSGTRHDLR